MADVLEPAASGRAKCRGCGEKIEKGVLRFGEAVPNAYGDPGDETRVWFHVPCAAERRPEKLSPLLGEAPDLPDRATVEDVVRQSLANPKLRSVKRGERSPSGRASCQHCHEKIAKGELRVVVEREGDTASMAMTSFVHARCAAGHLGRDGLVAKLRRAKSELLPSDLAELESLIEG